MDDMFTNVLNKVMVGAAATGVVIFGLAAPVSAHTEADLVAVPANHDTTLTFRPTHGCDGSPTVEVSVRIPVAGATGDDVSGWTTSINDTGTATEITWSEGSLPADQAGAFPVNFTAPDTVGELVLLPAVQVCENGEELAWIDGDPESSYPAPRLLILSADAQPAETIDDVDPDAPGRDLLTAIVDVDNPDSTEPDGEGDTEDPDGAGATDPGETVDPTDLDEPTPISALDEPDVEVGSSDDDSDSMVLPIVLGVLAVGVLIGIAFVLFRKQDPAGPSGDGQ